ncbi:uncharacterized protein BYT42DRAFT_571799 [Radiomyces spectabilis]|uniref:uncharacterized protein n=1 Tax=Radiomyces spectabilis TaxID=64574 RepID=UPI002220FA96|nr:uncharacterized protein BYT42DRAFT_571799 [Radiomyces spectabilis]KAI8377816.1 hypothetical protein BYT42DRAFT_571799 [Radiomyces spectabilis]
MVSHTSRGTSIMQKKLQANSLYSQFPAMSVLLSQLLTRSLRLHCNELHSLVKMPSSQRYSRFISVSKAVAESPKSDSKGAKASKIKESWQPKKRVSRVVMGKIRDLAIAYPQEYNSVKLAEEFKLSVEAVRRILKSSFRPTTEQAERQERNRYQAMGERKKQLKSQYGELSGSTEAKQSPNHTKPSPKSRKQNQR